MGAKPCLPPCTDARGPLCLELINGEGKLCEPRDGPTACSALRSCGSDCANQWLSPMQLFRSITWRHHWVLFVGDSDTRGLIIGLLQLLATAGYGAELASHSRALWLGGANNDSQATMDQASRMCHVDFSYDANARQLSSRTLPCLNEPLGHSFNISSYATVGENYRLRAPTPGAQQPSLYG